MKIFKQRLRAFMRSRGFDIVRFQLGGLGVNPFLDMQYFMCDRKSPVVLDVGANVGQSVTRFRHFFPDSYIHSFEPSPSTFEQLKINCSGVPRLSLWNYGVAASTGALTFRENNHSDMSSFLNPGPDCWGNVVQETEVRTITLDSFTAEQGIDFVHILKSDTQGFEMEVFKGAARLMGEGRIGLIYFEFIFSRMYRNLPAFDEVFRLLSDNGFSIVAVYEQNFEDNVLSWTDVLFVSQAFKESRRLANMREAVARDE